MLFCNRVYFSRRAERIRWGFEPESDMPFMEQLAFYTRYDWTENQSICFEGKSSVTLTPVPAPAGLCFTLGADREFLNHDT